MTEHRHLALEDQLRNVSHGSFLEQSVVGLEVEPPISEDLPQDACPERVKLKKEFGFGKPLTKIFLTSSPFCSPTHLYLDTSVLSLIFTKQ